MICRLVQYRITCDVAGCKSSTGARVTEQEIDTVAKSLGWESCSFQSNPVVIYRCPKCVEADKFPECWKQEKVCG